MRYDIILCGVGGQGVLLTAGVIARAAAAEGLFVKQSEVHGMSQRGGAVVSHLRLSDSPIASDLVGKGSAHLILSLEPVESLRYLPYLSPAGTLVTATNPFDNIPNYPKLEEILAQIRSLPHAVTVDAEALAGDAGDIRAANMVVVGAAAHVLPLKVETMESVVREIFAKKAAGVAEVNIAAFRSGRAAGAASPAQ
jgi:indolepyruvate ferredoxin oxidoreductase beta subunit